MYLAGRPLLLLLLRTLVRVLSDGRSLLLAQDLRSYYYYYTHLTHHNTRGVDKSRDEGEGARGRPRRGEEGAGRGEGGEGNGGGPEGRRGER